MQYKYVLITPARNEEAYIEKTIHSVISQTILPKEWVIVSDGSKDQTDDIVAHYAEKYDFIQLLHAGTEKNRGFDSMANAIAFAYKQIKSVQFGFIGKIDADVSFAPTTFELLIQKFQQNPILGRAGGAIFEVYGKEYFKQTSSLSWSVGGPLEMFRRQCYEEIGGHMPLKGGGTDTIADVMARMKGWEVRSFYNIEILHHRRTATEQTNIYLARFHQGRREYKIGYHPLFHVAKCAYRIVERPYVIGSLLKLVGYCWAFLLRERLEVPHDVVKFQKNEQILRLLALFWRPKARLEGANRDEQGDISSHGPS